MGQIALPRSQNVHFPDLFSIVPRFLENAIYSVLPRHFDYCQKMLRSKYFFRGCSRGRQGSTIKTWIIVLGVCLHYQKDKRDFVLKDVRNCFLKASIEKGNEKNSMLTIGSIGEPKMEEIDSIKTLRNLGKKNVLDVVVPMICSWLTLSRYGLEVNTNG